MHCVATQSHDLIFFIFWKFRLLEQEDSPSSRRKNPLLPEKEDSLRLEEEGPLILEEECLLIPDEEDLGLLEEEDCLLIYINTIEQVFIDIELFL